MTVTGGGTPTPRVSSAGGDGRHAPAGAPLAASPWAAALAAAGAELVYDSRGDPSDPCASSLYEELSADHLVRCQRGAPVTATTPATRRRAHRARHTRCTPPPKPSPARRPALRRRGTSVSAFGGSGKLKQTYGLYSPPPSQFLSLIEHHFIRDMAVLYQAPAMTVHTAIRLGVAVCGHPTIVHGGLTGAIFDETFGALLFNMRREGQVAFHRRAPRRPQRGGAPAGGVTPGGAGRGGQPHAPCALLKRRRAAGAALPTPLSPHPCRPPPNPALAAPAHTQGLHCATRGGLHNAAALSIDHCVHRARPVV